MTAGTAEFLMCWGLIMVIGPIFWHLLTDDDNPND